MPRLLLLAGLSAAACAPAAPPAPTQIAGAGQCDASKVQALVGKDGDPELGESARMQAGAKTLRWLAPGDIVTQDYRPDRLNIDVDDAGRIKRLRCG